MDVLTALDTEFLHLEDGVAHMHIAGACVFAGEAPSLDEVRGLLASRLHLIPRYRQRVQAVPLEIGRPLWVDDPHFELDYHVHATALDAPGDDAAFRALMGRLMSQPLDRRHPLWQAWLVPGMPDGRWALVFKVHHCLVDGIAGVDLLGVLLDLAPDAARGEPEPWRPRPEPSAVAQLARTWRGFVSDAINDGRIVVGLLGDPRGAVGYVRNTASGLARFLLDIPAPPLVSIEGTIGARRVWAHASASLDDIRHIRAAFGGTVNDVVLTAVTGGYRDLLLARGDDVDHATIRSMVPVSTRGDDGHGVPDNRVSTLLYDLPVHVADPVERLALVEEQMGELKGSHMAEAGKTVTTVTNLAPPMIVGTVSRLAVRVMHRIPQRSVNTITTNVPGPQFPLFCLGREMLEYRPFVPIIHGIRVSTAILSYNGRLYFGVTGDADSVPEVDVVAAGAARGVEVLRRRADAAGI